MSRPAIIEWEVVTCMQHLLNRIVGERESIKTVTLNSARVTVSKKLDDMGLAVGNRTHLPVPSLLKCQVQHVANNLSRTNALKQTTFSGINMIPSSISSTMPVVVLPSKRTNFTVEDFFLKEEPQISVHNSPILPQTLPTGMANHMNNVTGHSTGVGLYGNVGSGYKLLGKEEVVFVTQLSNDSTSSGTSSSTAPPAVKKTNRGRRPAVIVDDNKSLQQYLLGRTPQEYLKRSLSIPKGLRGFLIAHLELNDIPGTKWLDKDEKIFIAKWIRKNSPKCSVNDFELFKEWEKFKGRDISNFGGSSDWKTRIRCAFRKQDIMEIPELRGVMTTQAELDTYKVFKFCTESEMVQMKHVGSDAICSRGLRSQLAGRLEQSGITLEECEETGGAERASKCQPVAHSGRLLGVAGGPLHVKLHAPSSSRGGDVSPGAATGEQSAGDNIVAPALTTPIHPLPNIITKKSRTGVTTVTNGITPAVTAGAVGGAINEVSVAASIITSLATLAPAARTPMQSGIAPATVVAPVRRPLDSTGGVYGVFQVANGVSAPYLSSAKVSSSERGGGGGRGIALQHPGHLSPPGLLMDSAARPFTASTSHSATPRTNSLQRHHVNNDSCAVSPDSTGSLQPSRTTIPGKFKVIFRDWLSQKTSEGNLGGLRWMDDEKTSVCMKWKRLRPDNHNTWNWRYEDYELFKEWEQYYQHGSGNPNINKNGPRQWKFRFRMALKKAEMVEVRSFREKGENYKVFTYAEYYTAPEDTGSEDNSDGEGVAGVGVVAVAGGGVRGEPALCCMCPVCHRLFHSQLEVVLHVKEDHADAAERYPCTDCSLRFAELDAVQEHWIRDHQPYHIHRPYTAAPGGGCSGDVEAASIRADSPGGSRSVPQAAAAGSSGSVPALMVPLDLSSRPTPAARRNSSTRNRADRKG